MKDGALQFPSKILHCSMSSKSTGLQSYSKTKLFICYSGWRGFGRLVIDILIPESLFAHFEVHFSCTSSSQLQRTHFSVLTRIIIIQIAFKMHFIPLFSFSAPSKCVTIIYNHLFSLVNSECLSSVPFWVSFTCALQMLSIRKTRFGLHRWWALCHFCPPLCN